MKTIIFIRKASFTSGIGLFQRGRMKSINITPAIEFKPVEIELKEIFEV